MMADTNQHAKDNAAAWWQTIQEQVAALDEAREASYDDLAADVAREAILESVLDVCVRGGWRAPGTRDDEPPEEYYVLLTTGGPALRIYGRLGSFNEPDLDPILQWQDWGALWSDWWPEGSADIPYKDILRRWLEPFYFGD